MQYSLIFLDQNIVQAEGVSGTDTREPEVQRAVNELLNRPLALVEKLVV